MYLKLASIWAPVLSSIIWYATILHHLVLRWSFNINDPATIPQHQWSCDDPSTSMILRRSLNISDPILRWSFIMGDPIQRQPFNINDPAMVLNVDTKDIISLIFKGEKYYLCINNWGYPIVDPLTSPTPLVEGLRTAHANTKCHALFVKNPNRKNMQLRSLMVPKKIEHSTIISFQKYNFSCIFMF